MATVKLRRLDDTCAGITIPLSDLRREGIVSSEPGEPIELREEQHVHVERDGPGVWRVELASPEQPKSAAD